MAHRQRSETARPRPGGASVSRLGNAARTRRRVLLLLGLAAAQAGCTAMLLGGGGQGAPSAASELVGNVRAKIAADSMLAGQAVAVSSPAPGVVTLRGRVATRAQKERADALARTVTGVTDVDNRLAVQGGS